ncbi:MAG: ABC transporter ATP-binding protein, partial [Chloroflexi bacterium]|nr:ABC transporter ATP-binding protein [Chloroflexota bacterium]
GRIVERSDVYTIFNEPQHPYTQALLHSIPKIAMRRDDLVPIKGMVPSPFRRPSGCHFHPRCAQRFDLCNQIEPVNTYLNEDHQVRCLLYEDVAERDPNSEVVSHG